MGSVTLSNVSKSYGHLQTLFDVNAAIPEGGFTVLVGPSGCGKSTLLRMIAGLEDITSGTIRIEDRVVNDVESKNRDIAMVFQNYALYPHMTVEKNMGFSLWLAKVPKAEIKARVAQAAKILDLTPYLDRYPKQLSGGQRQRVAMGRAIVREPKVYLFDEPLSNLDAKLRVQMRAELKAIHRKLRTTTIYVTHDQIEAMTMGDQIIVMRAGKIEQMGAPLELYDRPQNTFVATFIGSPAMNLLPATVDAQGALVLEDGTRLQSPLSLREGQNLLLGLRPEDLCLSEGEGLSLVVEAVESTGGSSLVTGHLAGQSVTADLRERLTIETGQTLALRIDPSKIHLFDGETQKRLEA